MWSALAALTGLLAVVGYWLLFTTFMVYDDEGYVLFSLRNFGQGGRLYDDVYTQYGPFPYLFYDGLRRVLGFGFDNTAARWLTLFNWIGASGMCALLVARCTRSVMWGLFTLAATFTYLWAMVCEPGHPGGLVTSIIAGVTCTGALLWQKARIKGFVGLVAVTGSILALIKINVGIFFLGSAVAWLALNMANGTTARVVTTIVAVGCAALPLVLMKTLIQAPWAQLYALVFVSSVLSLLMTARVHSARTVTPRHWVTLCAGVAATTVLILALTVARGTSLGALLNGILLQPMKHPGVYFHAVQWESSAVWIALLSFAGACWSVRPGMMADPRFREAIAWTRVLAAIAFLVTRPSTFDSHLPAWGMSYGVSLAWIFAIPLHKESRHTAVRTWVSLVLAFQFLHAYPVAGSQVNWGTFLWVTLFSLGLHDAGLVLRCRITAQDWPRWIAFGVLGAAVVAMIAPLANLGRERYAESQPFGLPGATNIRLALGDTARYRALALNAAVHADQLFTLPGMFSFNLWTDLPAPTLSNVTHWFSLLSDTQQREAIASLEAHPRASVIVQTGHLAYLRHEGLAPHGLLYDYIQRSFTPAFGLDGFEFRVRTGRKVAAFLTAELYDDRNNFSQYDSLIRMQLLLAVGATIAQVEIATMTTTGPTPAVVLKPSDIKIESVPINMAGEPVGAPRAQTLPFALNEPSQVAVHFNRGASPISPAHSLIVLRDAAGHELALVRLLP